MTTNYMYSLSYVTRRCRLYYLKELFFIINKTILPAHCGATSLFANNSIFFRSTSKICTDPYSTRRELSFELGVYELCGLRSDDEYRFLGCSDVGLKINKVQRENKKIQSGLSTLKYFKCVFTSKNVVDSYSTRQELSFEV